MSIFHRPIFAPYHQTFLSCYIKKRPKTFENLNPPNRHSESQPHQPGRIYVAANYRGTGVSFRSLHLKQYMTSSHVRYDVTMLLGTLVFIVVAFLLYHSGYPSKAIAPASQELAREHGVALTCGNVGKSGGFSGRSGPSDALHLVTIYTTASHMDYILYTSFVMEILGAIYRSHIQLGHLHLQEKMEGAWSTSFFYPLVCFTDGLEPGGIGKVHG
jgi:hypothetical protein